MDNEVSNGIQITVTLMVLSVIVGIIVLFTTMGQAFSRQATDTVVDAIGETYASQLITTQDYGAVPAASVFVLLQKNQNSIESIHGHAYGVTITQISDLYQLFDKKIQIRINQNGANFNVLVLEEHTILEGD